MQQKVVGRGSRMIASTLLDAYYRRSRRADVPTHRRREVAHAATRRFARVAPADIAYGGRGAADSFRPYRHAAMSRRYETFRS